MKGVYKLKNPQKFIKPIDGFMNSYKDGKVLYKSLLELSAIKFCDYNPKVLRWSLEPFHIKYVNPLDNKIHRYYPDVYMEFKNKNFLVEIKPSSQVVYPKDKRMLPLFLKNRAKFKFANDFCIKNNMHFKILTEKELR